MLYVCLFFGTVRYCPINERFIPTGLNIIVHCLARVVVGDRTSNVSIFDVPSDGDYSRWWANIVSVNRVMQDVDTFILTLRTISHLAI